MSSPPKNLPIALTLDVHDQPKIDCYLDESTDVLAEMGIRATYFVPADVFRKYRKNIMRIGSRHQIACHGLFHDRDEAYDRMPYAVQRDYLDRATTILADGMGTHPGAFRAPGFRISGVTLELLQEYGYYADVSVNSGRLGVTSTYNRENGWFLAPRLPYHPDSAHPFKHGGLSLWEIPVSALILPLTSNAAVILGKHLTVVFASLLLAECRVRPKPVVYMSHPEDLCRTGPDRQRGKFSLKLLLPTEGGILIRHYLAAKKPEVFFGVSYALIRRLQRPERSVFLTVQDYVQQYLGEAASRVEANIAGVSVGNK
jgi:Polysaccharide deacetylase